MEAQQLDADGKRALLSRLLGRLAHEIRNPLSSLDIHVQLLAEDLAALPEAARGPAAARLQILRSEIHRLEGIIRQFIGLASPTELAVQPVDLARLLGHVHALLAAEARQRRIDFQLEQTIPPPPLRADPGQLTQALVNLVINAIQAVGHDGHISLRSRLASGEPSVIIEVADSGPGIPSEIMDTMFEPFFTTKQDGSGLGLWIVRQIVSAHHGEVRAANRAEGGACFEIRLPLTSAEATHG